MRNSLSLGLLLTVILLLSGASKLASAQVQVGQANEGVDLTRKPPYWREARLDVPVEVPAVKRKMSGILRRLPNAPSERVMGVYTTVHLVNQVIIPIRTMINAIHDKSGTAVLIRGDWMRGSIAVPERSVLQAREWMDRLEEAFAGAQWTKVGATWVLARTPTEASLTALSGPERKARARELTRILVNAITAEQWKGLAAAERIELPKFQRAQIQPVFDRLRLEYYDPERHVATAPSADAVIGRRVYLRLEGRGRQAQLVILAPGATQEFRVAERFFDPQSGDLAWGVPPPR